MTYFFQFYPDAGHGWLKVPTVLLRELKVANDISSCSYQRGPFTYLEEDCDAGKLLTAIEQKGDVYSIDHRPSVDRSAIRNYERYRP